MKTPVDTAKPPTRRKSRIALFSALLLASGVSLATFAAPKKITPATPLPATALPAPLEKNAPPASPLIVGFSDDDDSFEILDAHVKHNRVIRNRGGDSDTDSVFVVMDAD